MRISTYKADDGSLSVMVEAAPGHGKPPVVLPKVTRENLKALLTPVLDFQRGRRVMIED